MSLMNNLYHKLYVINKLFNRPYTAFGIICLALSSYSAVGAEITIGELSNGSCWYQQSDEHLKLVSFNEKRSINMSMSSVDDFLYTEITKNMNLKKELPYHSLGTTLHCGGYGASLVVKSRIGDAVYCSWLGMGEDGLKIRSTGGLEEQKKESSLCDGYRNLELMIGLSSKEQIDELSQDNFASVVKKVEPITDRMVKVTLDERFMGKEDEAVEELKRMMNLRYIEFNLIQHQVGESVNLK